MGMSSCYSKTDKYPTTPDEILKAQIQRELRNHPDDYPSIGPLAIAVLTSVDPQPAALGGTIESMGGEGVRGVSAEQACKGCARGMRARGDRREGAQGLSAQKACKR